jgi:hypothetical protein
VAAKRSGPNTRPIFWLVFLPLGDRSTVTPIA